MKTLKNYLIGVIISVMLFGTTCFAEGDVYYDGKTINETVLVLQEQCEQEKLVKTNYEYVITSTENTIIVTKKFDAVGGMVFNSITSYIYDKETKTVTIAVTTSMGELSYTQSNVVMIDVEIK